MASLSFDAGAAAYERFMGRWSRLYIPALLEAAGVGPHQRVLDLATGTGEAAAQAAARVAPSGLVVGTDISLPMLGAAARRLTGQPVTLAAMDATAMACPDEAFDAVICQLGLMLVPDPARAAAECRRVLRRGGRIAACVWSSVERVPLIGLLAEALARRLPGQQEEFLRGCSLGAPDRLEAMLAGAGFRDVTVKVETRELTIESFDDYWEPVEAGGARLGQAFKGLPEDARRAVREEVHERMARFESGGRLVLPNEALLAAATK